MATAFVAALIGAGAHAAGAAWATNGSGNAATVGGTCAGVVGSTSRSENVSAGTWTYTDSPVQLTWNGQPSPASAPLTVLPG